MNTPSHMDTFFSQEACDRCNGDLKVRTMSWFTNETICMTCSGKESEIKRLLDKKFGPGADLAYEGCGYIPDPQTETAPPKK